MAAHAIHLSRQRLVLLQRPPRDGAETLCTEMNNGGLLQGKSNPKSNSNSTSWRTLRVGIRGQDDGSWTKREGRKSRGVTVDDGDCKTYVEGSEWPMMGDSCDAASEKAEKRRGEACSRGKKSCFCCFSWFFEVPFPFRASAWGSLLCCPGSCISSKGPKHTWTRQFS